MHTSYCEHPVILKIGMQSNIVEKNGVNVFFNKNCKCSYNYIYSNL